MNSEDAKDAELHIDETVTTDPTDPLADPVPESDVRLPPARERRKFHLVTPAMRAKEAKESQEDSAIVGGRRTLKQYMDLYNLKSNPHPWVHLFKAIPMGTRGEVPMNHDLRTLNLIAIHAERLGFKEPENPEIKYVPPEYGPNVVYNPGTWVDIDAVLPDVSTEPPKIDLEGAPPDQLAILQQAIDKEHMRLAKIAQADPIPRAELAATPDEATLKVEVVPTETPSAGGDSE